jgi:DNA topoisomerase IB
VWNDAGSIISDAAIITITTGIKESISNFYISPNPTNDNVTISMDILEAGNVMIALIDITGTERMQLHNTFTDVGQFTKTFSLADFPQGMYYIKIKHNENIKLEKVIRR